MSKEPLNRAERLLLLRERRWAVRFANLGLSVFCVGIPETVSIGTGLRLPHNGISVVIHDSTVIHDRVRIYPGVTIGRSDLYYDWDEVTHDGGVVVEDEVVIGTGAKVMFRSGQRLTLGARCVIGANAVVTRSVPPGEVWAGVPAKRVSVNPIFETVLSKP